jgi:hypothetical protein
MGGGYVARWLRKVAKRLTNRATGVFTATNSVPDWARSQGKIEFVIQSNGGPPVHLARLCLRFSGPKPILNWSPAAPSAEHSGTSRHPARAVRVGV